MQVDTGKMLKEKITVIPEEMYEKVNAIIPELPSKALPWGKYLPRTQNNWWIEGLKETVEHKKQFKIKWLTKHYVKNLKQYNMFKYVVKNEINSKWGMKIYINKTKYWLSEKKRKIQKHKLEDRNCEIM